MALLSLVESDPEPWVGNAVSSEIQQNPGHPPRSIAERLPAVMPARCEATSKVNFRCFSATPLGKWAFALAP